MQLKLRRIAWCSWLFYRCFARYRKAWLFLGALMFVNQIMSSFLFGLDLLPAKIPTTLNDMLYILDCRNASTAHRRQSQMKNFLSESSIIKRTSDGCENYFKTVFTAAFDQETEEETSFPIAFSHVVHENVGILEMFLSTHFRATDRHCIHVDLKARPKVIEATTEIVKCYQERFPGSIFLSDNRVAVFDAHISVLTAELICLTMLQRNNPDWKMYINMAGNEIPLVPLNKIRETIRNKPDMDNVDYGFTPTQSHQKKRLEIENSTNGELVLREYDDESKPKPPCKLFIMRGYRNIVATRDFTKFITESSFVKIYYDWISSTSHPAEHFYATMLTLEEQSGPEELTKLITQKFDWQKTIPSQICFRENLWRLGSHCMLRRSGCNLDLQKSTLMNNMSPDFIGNNWLAGYCVRKSIWGKCSNKSKGYKCVLTMDELPLIRSSGCLLANEFDVEQDSSAIMCQVKELKNEMSQIDAQNQELNPM